MIDFMMNFMIDADKLVVLILLAFWLLFRRFAQLWLGLGRGPITPPGPAMVLMGRKEV